MIKTKKLYHELAPNNFHRVYDFRFKRDANSSVMEVVLIKTKITIDNKKSYEVYVSNSVEMSPFYYLLDDVIKFCVQSGYMDEEEIFNNRGLSDEELFAGMVFAYGEQEMLSKIHPCSTITKDDLIYYLYDSSFDFPDDIYLF